ncbi:MAG: histidine--tRNA ligase [Candidatus Delongbacteria bacterium]|nr:histidine--tRNA ligase [Candidatus Delongbacteria bacterium]MCG2761281.1 histidine--tRNA ligase [Candidatus Delongbacteria bacterium]
MKVNTNPVRGMKDFLPDEAELREKVKRTIIDTYTTFGYRKIETPALEHLELLSGGDGGENEKLIFKILKRGEKLDLAGAKEENDLVDSGLKFDLTVSLSRIYANNQGNIPLPFKVIQADYVWRAERPQKGRYRQFMQCDIDIIGEKDIIAEIDLLLASSQALLNIGFKDFTIKINDRKVLHDLADKWGFEEKDHDSVFIALDKLDKIGVNGIQKELESKSFPPEAINAMLAELKIFNKGDEIADSFLSDELIKVIEAVTLSSNGQFKIEFDPTLVRGMGYYTGMIYEIKCDGYDGSVGGGGRYDKMIGKRIGQDVPACGISIGFERIVDIMLEQGQEKVKKEKLAIMFDPEKDDVKRVYAEAEMQRLSNKYIVSVVKKEKKFGKQLKKLLDQGFTHYTEIFDNKTTNTIPLKTNEE